MAVIVKKKEYFNINGNKIFLKKTLIDFNGFPIFFLCNDDNDSMYISLCSNMDELEYILVPVPEKNIEKILNGKMSMRDFMLNSSDYFWEIKTGKEFDDDLIERKEISQIDKDVLPLEGAFFELTTDDLKNFAENFGKNTTEEIDNIVLSMANDDGFKKLL